MPRAIAKHQRWLDREFHQQAAADASRTAAAEKLPMAKAQLRRDTL